VASVDLELLGESDEIWDPLLGLANEDSSRESHAALTSSTESSTNQLVESGGLVGIWHDDTVVLSRHVRLDTLAILGTAVVDVAASLVRTDEGDGLDVVVVAQEVDGVDGTVNDVDNTIWKTGILGQLDEHHGSSWIALRWLQEHGVTGGNSHWEHPEWDHGWEVERADTSGDTEWGAVAVAVQILGNV